MELPFEYSSLAEFIKEERTLNNMSRKKLADESGVSFNMIERIENEKSVPTLSTIENIVESLGFQLCVKEKEYNPDEPVKTLSDTADGTVELDLD